MTSYINCDHSQCPARATECYVLGALELAFCGHHSKTLSEALCAQEWELIAAPVKDLAAAKGT